MRQIASKILEFIALYYDLLYFASDFLGFVSILFYSEHLVILFSILC